MIAALMISFMTASRYLPLQKKLLDWYSLNARDLPWRRTNDPYAIWVSEIMLQQTQVQTVIAYYERWLQKFPTLKSLAEAGIEDVLAVWAGLGYYRRARMIHTAAKKVFQELAGEIPQTVEELMELPGIGRYTAGAIASIAFRRKAPVLDGNVMRILSRVYAVEESISVSKTQAKLWALAEELLPDEKPGDLNQALMELGATVCFPLNPSCDQCPVSRNCAAFALGKQTSFPVKGEKEKPEKIEAFALVVRRENSVLLRRQPEYGRWGGLWMFPFWPTKKDLLFSSSLSEEDIVPFALIKHGFTKYRITLRVYESSQACEPRKLAVSEGGEDRWIPIDELSNYALPSPHKKIQKEVLQRYAAETPA